MLVRAVVSSVFPVVEISLGKGLVGWSVTQSPHSQKEAGASKNQSTLDIYNPALNNRIAADANSVACPKNNPNPRVGIAQTPSTTYFKR